MPDAVRRQSANSLNWRALTQWSYGNFNHSGAIISSLTLVSSMGLRNPSAMSATVEPANEHAFAVVPTRIDARTANRAAK